MTRRRPYLSVDENDISRNVLSVVPTQHCDVCDLGDGSFHSAHEIDTIELHSAIDFEDKLHEIATKHSYVLFRGQAKDWLLLPSAHRSDGIGRLVEQYVHENLPRYQAFREFRWKDETIAGFQNRFRLALRYLYEKELVYQSVILGQQDGLMDRAISNLQPTLIDLVFYLSSSSIPLRHDTSELQVWARHHGIPTKMLDFTLNYSVASWHAVQGKGETDETKSVVWAIAGKIPFDISDYSRGSEYFVRAQESAFLWNSCADYEFYMTGNYVPFDVRFRKSTKFKVFKIMLNGREASSLRTLFKNRGWSAYTMGAPMFMSVEQAEELVEQRRQKFLEKFRMTVERSTDFSNRPSIFQWELLRSRATMIRQHRNEIYVQIQYDDGILLTYGKDCLEIKELFSDVLSGQEETRETSVGQPIRWKENHGRDFKQWDKTHTQT